MEDWIEVKIDDICKINTGKWDANHSTSNGKYRFYTCAFEYSKCDTKRFEGECLILPGNGANVGEVFYYNGEFDAYQRTYVLDNFSFVFPKFLFYHLKGFWEKVNRDKQYGTATNYIRMGNFTDYSFPVFAIPIQRAIVTKLESLLTNLDKGIEHLEKAAAQLKIYRQAVLKKAFEGELTKAWRAQQSDLPSAEELLEEIKMERVKFFKKKMEEWEDVVQEWEENGKEGKKPSKPKKQKEFSYFFDRKYDFPKDWIWSKIGIIITGLTQGWSPKCENTPSNFGEWGVIKTTAVQDGYFLESHNKTLPKKLEPRKQHEIKENDILITRAGPKVRVGICCLVGKVRPMLINCDKVYRIRSLEKICYPSFLNLFLNSPIFKDKLGKIKSGINDSGVNIKQDIFQQMEIPMCSLKEQKKIIEEIESRLSVCDNLEKTITFNLQKSKALRQSILKKAFEGELLTEEEIAICKAAPDYEPANVLLEKIKAEKAEQAKAKSSKKKTKRKSQKVN